MTNNRTWIGMRTLGSLLLLAVLLGCVSAIERAEDYAAQDEWMKAVLEYRKAYADNPRDIELKSRLKQAELKAADFYYQKGMRLFERDDLDGAMVQFQQGLLAQSEHTKLQQAMTQVLARKDAAEKFVQAQDAAEAGNKDEAIRLLSKAIDIYPDFKVAVERLQELRKQTEEAGEEKLVLSSSAPITLNFRQTDLRTAFEFIAKSFGVGVIFDDGIKSAPVTMFTKDVTFDQAMSLMLATTRTFYKKIGPNTILIAPDSKEKRGQYEDHIVRTYQINSMRAKDMAELLKGILTIKKIIVNEQLNTLLLRDTEEVIRLADRIVEANDHKAAEMILDVELLEVNRSKAEKLGLDLGTYAVSGGVPSSATILAFKGIGRQLQGTATLTLPTATFNFYKQDVDAKILANPKIRVVNGKAAKIHIGDRVPLRAATIVDATGQTRTTYDYKDVGIRLTVEPTINLDNSTMVKMALEVSALGANIGSVSDPAFIIGTRNAETFMQLRDGETAILGGLIRDEDRKSRVRIPLLGDIPAVGSLFTSYDDSGGRTDVLLTITPRIVRGWDPLDAKSRSFYSGTENTYQDEPLFKSLATMKPGKVVAVAAAGAAATGAPAAGSPPGGAASGTPLAGSPAATSTPSGTTPGAGPPSTAPTPTTGSPAGATVPPTLLFGEPVYESTVNGEFEVQIVAQNLADIASIPVEILFNPQLLQFVRGEAGHDFATQDFSAEADAAKGLLTVRMNYAAANTPKGNGVLAKLVMKGAQSGVSYLVYRVPALQTVGGGSIPTQVRASRVVIK